LPDGQALQGRDQALQHLGTEVVIPLQMSLMRLKVFWLLVHILPSFFSDAIPSRSILGGMGHHMPQEGFRDLKLLPYFLEGKPQLSLDQ
jgi:hypothetical protein